MQQRKRSRRAITFGFQPDHINDSAPGCCCSHCLDDLEQPRFTSKLARVHAGPTFRRFEDASRHEGGPASSQTRKCKKPHVALSVITVDYCFLLLFSLRCCPSWLPVSVLFALIVDVCLPGLDGSCFQSPTITAS